MKVIKYCIWKFLLFFVIATVNGSVKEYAPFNGWYNNRGNPSAGSPDSIFNRRISSTYEDGVYFPSGPNRPNPRDLSTMVFSGESGLRSNSSKTALFYFFSEYVMEEITDVHEPGCPPEYFNIPVPVGDPWFDREGSGTIVIPYLRSRYQTANSGFSPNHPREQLNGVTSFLDGSVIYGSERTWSDQLRLRKESCPDRPTDHIFADQFGNDDSCSGELTSYQDKGKLPALNSHGLPLNNPVPPIYDSPLSATRFFQTGGKNINENPFLFAIGVIWFRHHNWWAKKLSASNSSWTDSRVFNEARIRNVATFQHIMMDEWLPLLLGDCSNFNENCSEIPQYSGYQPGASTRINDVFQAAAKQYIRTIAPEGVFARSAVNSDGNCQFSGMDDNNPFRVCNTYWISDEITQQRDIDELIMGMSSQFAEQEDHIINDDLRNFFHGPMSFSRRDLVANIIQQGRDHGLPGYNAAREELGLSRKYTIKEINMDLFDSNPALLRIMTELHGRNFSQSDVDIFVGGMLETANGQPGELFRLILLDQFRRLRDGDRFWYENEKNGLLNATEISEIKSTTFREVILRTNPSINERDIQSNPFVLFDNGNGSCVQPFQIGTESWNEECVELKTYDYFSGSEVSYAVVFASFGVFIFCAIGAMHLLAKLRQKSMAKMKRGAASKHEKTVRNKGVKLTITNEILGERATQQIQITFENKDIVVKNGRGNRTLRSINFDDVNTVDLFTCESAYALALRSANATYDLVVKLADEGGYEEFVTNLNNFFEENRIQKKVYDVLTENALLNVANTKERRDKELKKFFKTALSQSLSIGVETEITELNHQKSKKLANIEINKEEFAEYLKLKKNSSFVEHMFAVADVNDDERISFREFLDIMVLFTKGSPQDKVALMFNMYDTDRSGELSVEEFKKMLKSMMEMVSASVDVDQLDQLASDMMSSHGLGSKESLTLEDFQQLMGRYSEDLSEATLVAPGQAPPKAQPNATPAQNHNITANRKTKLHSGEHGNVSGAEGTTGIYKKRQTRFSRAQMTMRKQLDQRSENAFSRTRRHTTHGRNVKVVKEEYTKSPVKKWWIQFTKWNQHYRSHIFFTFLYTLITVGVFLQAHNVVASNLPSGLARVGGGWMAVARASAAALMFNFSTLLLTMSRNTITVLRETFLHRYVPFDAAISMHKLIAWMALLFTGIHVVAHGINFYSISTQSPMDLLCLFRDIWYPSNFLPDFVFWCFRTITGITGVLLTWNVIIMYVFASNFSRRAIFTWFQGTHKFGYIFMYFFSVLHGSGTLISSPRFYLFFLGPAVLYTLDKLYSLSRKKAEISVVNAELLPSDVTHLEFKRPPNFDYKAGQWVRIACLAQSPAEYHPFTLSSAPYEKTLKLHIRAVGPWTINLRALYNPETLRENPYPKLYLDGPFGEGHQDWYKYEVSVLVGGGIGVTPFASILKDLVNTTQSGGNVTCKSVYFIWVTRDQKQYEWLMDIIQEVEKRDVKGVLNTHIFITQFPQKFDLRTTMLYICEQHFQKIAGKSLFTGLRAITHFGRPNFPHFLNSLSDEHNHVQNFGVFSCGPPAMTSSVEKACSKLNRYEGPTYSHHFENF